MCPHLKEYTRITPYCVTFNSCKLTENQQQQAYNKDKRPNAAAPPNNKHSQILPHHSSATSTVQTKMPAVTMHVEQTLDLQEWMPATELQTLTLAAVLFVTVHDLQQTHTLIIHMYNLPSIMLMMLITLIWEMCSNHYCHCF